jgi:NADH:ubiquinone oxidoreductase subunit 3 (subunit A)
MFLYLVEYYALFIYLLICLILSLLLVFLAKILSPRYIYAEKLSAYECGFEPFYSARTKFDVSFAIIAILFLVFDLEIIFLIPWALNVIELGVLGFIIMYIFLFILVLGFLFEILRNVLDWDNVFK